jgi:hypothetical protein
MGTVMLAFLRTVLSTDLRNVGTKIRSHCTPVEFANTTLQALNLMQVLAPFEFTLGEKRVETMKLAGNPGFYSKLVTNPEHISPDHDSFGSTVQVY